MRQRFTTGCLTAVGALILVAASGTENTDRSTDPAEVLRQLGVPDTIADQWVEPYIPLWALTQEAPVVGLEVGVGALTSSATTDCPPSLEIELVAGSIALRFDEQRRVTELYDYSGDGFTTRYDIDSNLSYSTALIPTGYVGIELAVDLDQDGDVEIVAQYFDHLFIISSPDGALLAEFIWPGLSVQMQPVAIDIDDDPYLEVYVTPVSLGLDARVVIIDYNPVTGGYEKIADMEAPYGAIGYPAVGDFDQDGRVEFISGTFGYGYRLYEWQESTLAYIGLVGDSLGNMNYNAVACRPKPGGKLHAVLGHSGYDVGYYYQLLEPTGDNTFQVSHVFQENTGATGVHPCWAADTDCDGLEEIAFHLWPVPDIVWGWDVDSGCFVSGCQWDHDLYGSFNAFRDVDLDQNGAREWATLNHLDLFQVFPDPDCQGCDSTGHCEPPILCYCDCFADPMCDGQTNVLDVVHAVDVAFRSGQPLQDPFPHCPVERTDVDCDSDSDILDVVHFINVAFRSGDPATDFCEPCP